MLTLLLSLWVTGALLLPMGWGTASDFEDDDNVTPTPDYDYNATFDYYLYTILEKNVEDEKGHRLIDFGENVENHGNKDSVPVYRLYVIITGLLVLKICQQE